MASEDIYDPAIVKQVFDRCSGKYIAFSTLCSLGFTKIWRRQCVEMLALPMGAKSGYDLMAGTGRLGRIYSKNILLSRKSLRSIFLAGCTSAQCPASM